MRRFTCIRLTPPKGVLDAYYCRLLAVISMLFSIAGCGWRIETGIHVTRMILGGVFDRFPNLKIVIGHMGEGLTFWMQRMDWTCGKDRPS